MSRIAKKSLVVLTLALAGLVSCKGSSISSSIAGSSSSVADSASTPDANKVTVTFKNGNEILKTEEIAKGGKASAFTPAAPAGKTFINWYGTPTYSILFDFDKALSEDTTVFAAFSTYTADTKDYFIAGNGGSPVLSASNWGADGGADATKLVKKDVANANIYELTLDLYNEDMFQVTSFTDTKAWDWQYGFGCVSSPDMELLDCAGGLAGSTRKSNIKVKKDGNYTITFQTFPEFDDAATKVNNVNYLKIKRNGDLVVPKAQFTYDFYLKGEKITAWKDMYNDQTKMAMDADKDTYTLTSYIAAEDQFMFSSMKTAADGTVSLGDKYINYSNLDDTSKALVEASDNNIKTKTSGAYTFTYKLSTSTLAIAIDSTKGIVDGQYYINGKIGEHNWDTVFTAGFKLAADAATANTYVISNVALAKDDEFTLAKFKADATEPGDSWCNKIGSFNFANVSPDSAAKDAFQAKDKCNNILVLTAGNYDISFNAYSSMITLALHA